MKRGGLLRPMGRNDTTSERQDDGRLLLHRGIRLFNNHEFFACHEVLEEAWRPARGRRRLFLQALIHLAVGFYHCQRGNPAGASRQLHKGLGKLAGYLPWCDTARVYREARAALQQIEDGVVVPEYPQIRIDPV